MNAAGESGGVQHLATIGRRARPAGSAAEDESRQYAARVLTALGFVVTQEPFEYSAFPGRFGAPVGGALVAATVLLSSAMALASAPAIRVALSMAVGLVLSGWFARNMLRDGVSTLPLMRRHGINLVATRAGEPRVWLMAHLDSKSQPIPSVVRVAGILLLALGLVIALGATGVALAGAGARTLWWGAVLATGTGALPVLASVVGERSPGAVDNASGVAAVLAAAALLDGATSCGVVLPTAEELGLAGARAWARAHPRGVVLNCDGVDDEGEVVIMYNQRKPVALVNAICAASSESARVRRMPLGLLTDSTALAGAGWEAVTVSHGSLKTLRRIHTAGDSLASLRGTAIDRVAAILARAAEALAS